MGASGSGEPARPQRQRRTGAEGLFCSEAAARKPPAGLAGIRQDGARQRAGGGEKSPDAMVSPKTATPIGSAIGARDGPRTRPGKTLPPEHDTGRTASPGPSLTLVPLPVTGTGSRRWWDDQRGNPGLATGRENRLDRWASRGRESSPALTPGVGAPRLPRSRAVPPGLLARSHPSTGHRHVTGTGPRARPARGPDFPVYSAAIRALTRAHCSAARIPPRSV